MPSAAFVQVVIPGVPVACWNWAMAGLQIS